MSEFLDCCPSCGYKADSVKKAQTKHTHDLDLSPEPKADLFLTETYFLKSVLNRLKEKGKIEELETTGKTIIDEGERASHITVDALKGSIIVKVIDRDGATAQIREFCFDREENPFMRKRSAHTGAEPASSKKNRFSELFFGFGNLSGLKKYTYKNNLPTWHETNSYQERYDKIKIFYKNIPSMLEMGESVKRIFDKSGNELQVGVGKGKYILKMIYKCGSTKTEHIGYNFITGGFLYEVEKETKK